MVLIFRFSVIELGSLHATYLRKEAEWERWEWWGVGRGGTRRGTKRGPSRLAASIAGALADCARQLSKNIEGMKGDFSEQFLAIFGGSSTVINDMRSAAHFPVLPHTFPLDMYHYVSYDHSIYGYV